MRNDKLVKIIERLYENDSRFVKEDDIYTAVEDEELSLLDIDDDYEQTSI